jgi:hypothetical protein
MILIAQIRLTSRFLGSGKPQKGIRKLRMLGDTMVEINRKEWLIDLQNASRNLKLDVDLHNSVVLPEGILAPSVHLYRRVYSGVKVDFFESLRENTILTFDLMLRDECPNCPTLDQFKDILTVDGEYYGISQWGNKFGYGKFKVENLYDRYAQNNHEPSNLKTSVSSTAGEP